MPSQIRLNNFLLPVLVISLFIMQLIDPSRVWTILLVGLGGIWLASFIWARELSKHVSLVREMRYGWVQVGDALEERFTLQNGSVFPAIWVEIEDRSTLPGYNASIATGVDGKSINQWRRKGTCARRGLYTLGNTLAHSGDPFGIYTVTFTDAGQTSLMVMPPVVPLPVLDITPGGFSGDGRPLPHSPKDALDASNVREYMPQDSMRLIHWKTTARHGKPFVRVFDNTPASDWWILLDLQNAIQIGKGDDGTEEHGIILAASLADLGLRKHRGVGLIVNGQRLDWLPPRCTTGQRWDILRVLALASRGETPLTEVLEHIRPDLGRHASLLIITPTVVSDWLPTLPHLRWRGIIPTIFTLNPRSFGGQTDNRQLIAGLQKMGVAHYDMPRGMFDRPEARPGSRGQWEWRVSATGRAVPVRSPDDYTWQRL